MSTCPNVQTNHIVEFTCTQPSRESRDIVLTRRNGTYSITNTYLDMPWSTLTVEDLIALHNLIGAALQENGTPPE